MEFDAVLLVAFILIVWLVGRAGATPGVDGVVPVPGGYRSYRVHRDLDGSGVAADRLALLERRAALLLDSINRRFLFGGQPYAIDGIAATNSPAAAAARRLARRYSPDALVENAPGVDGTAFTLDKGSLIAMCLREAEPGTPLATSQDGYPVDEVLLFVFLHELSHVAADGFGHGPEFWSTFKWILQEALVAPGLGRQLVAMDFDNRPTSYCGIAVDHNPLYDPNIAPLSTSGPV